MHLKKSEDQIGEESIGFSADFSPPHLLQICISNPSSNHGVSLQSSQISSTPHKRILMNHKTPAPAKIPVSEIRLPKSSPPRILLPIPFSSATRSAFRYLLHRIRFRLRFVLLLFFPYLYFLFVNLQSAPTSSSLSSGRSLLIVFLSAVVFSSAILFLIFLQLNLVSLSSLRLLLSRKCSLITRFFCGNPPVEFYIGSPIENSKSGLETASGFYVEIRSNEDVFEGEFYKGKYSGSGVYYHYLRGRYEGDWVDDKYDGYGIETWAIGNRYMGQYKQGSKHGFGVYLFHTGDFYAGEWFHGRFHGYGVYIFKDGSRYAGDFNFGIKHGIGRYNFRNGDAYAGQYFGDKIHGYGVYHFASAHRYEGSWYEGRRQGFGVYFFRNGETQAGHWQNGALNLSSTQNSLLVSPLTVPASPVAVNHSKVLDAVQEAQKAAERANSNPNFDEHINKIVAAANKAANAARVAAVKAVQWQDLSK